MNTALKRAKSWLKETFDEATRREVQRMIDSDPKALSDAFFQELSFGTGGMRALMGVGTNRLNIYTIRAATLGLANAILQQPHPPKGHSVFIGYDVRNHSKEFAEEAARVLAASGIRVRIAREICPTPLVSYGCRHFGCSAAIMITASHNPPAYNGYKVYWNDGGQIVFPHDQEIIAEVRKVTVDKPIPLSPLDSPLIVRVGHELDEAYLKELKCLQLYPPKPVKILYTPLHGTGIRIIPEALRNWGYEDLSFVEEQKNPDGNFTHAPSPNPEEKKALELGTKQLLKEQQDLLIATDPDADRMGIVVLDKGKPAALTGNQIACLCLHHICTALTSRGEFPSNAAFIKTIVTTELFRKIAEHFGGVCIDVLTGFKYIGEQMTLWQNSFDAYQYVFGAEESYGYLFGTLVRDKDAISASCLITEAAALTKKQNLTLADRLCQIYEKFGVHRESLANLSFEEGSIGREQMNALMQRLRKKPPSAIGAIPVQRFEDYLSSKSKNLVTNQTDALTLPKSDVLRFWLHDGSKLVIRPSGTEPKIKIYGEVVHENVTNADREIQLADERLKNLIEAFRNEAL
jgi:phosphoglucomutase/phosphomannomutase